MLAPPTPLGPGPRHAEPTDAELRRRRRQRNLAMLVVLFAVSALFYAIALVKLAKPGSGG